MCTYQETIAASKQPRFVCCVCMYVYYCTAVIDIDTLLKAIEYYSKCGLLYILFTGLVQFQVTLMTSAQNPRQLNIEEIKDVTEQVSIYAIFIPMYN